MQIKLQCLEQQITENEAEIEVNPNRPDLLSYQDSESF